MTTHEEKRRMKYPDTPYFHYYNANPKNKITTDCVIRAICTVLDKPYNTVVMEMAELQCKTGLDDAENKCIDKYMKQHGWIRVKQPKKEDNTKYTGKEFCQALQNFEKSSLGLIGCKTSKMLVSMGSHHIVAVVNNKVWDHWNSTNGKVGQIWINPSI